MKKLFLLIPALYLLGACTGSHKKNELSTTDKEFLTKQADGIYAKFETNKGDIYTFLESKKTPMTVANFVGLAEGKIKNTAKGEGVPFYDGLKFHRVIADFMIQGGCPNGDGSGDPGYIFPNEIDMALKHNGPGILSMANRGPNTNGSQFFITHREYPAGDGNYSVFGHVIQGQDVVNMIVVGDTIKKVVIMRKGKEAEAFDAPKVFDFERTNIPLKATARVNALFEKAKVTASGLKYIIEKEGTGNSPKPTDQVTLFYRGTFLDGREFDGNMGKGVEPATLRLNQFIPGWVEGVQLMKPGGKAMFYIPYKLAYGESGHPSGVIPPKSDLIFEIELLKVN